MAPLNGILISMLHSARLSLFLLRPSILFDPVFLKSAVRLNIVAGWVIVYGEIGKMHHPEKKIA